MQAAPASTLESLAAELAALPPAHRWAVIGRALELAHLLRVEVPGPVVSKNRALRFSGQRAFRTAESRAYQDWAAWQARSVMREREPLARRLAVVLTVIAPDRRSIADADNASKAPLDAFRGIVYRDDRQIDHLLVRRQIVPGRQPTLLVGVEEVGG